MFQCICTSLLLSYQAVMSRPCPDPELVIMVASEGAARGSNAFLALQ